MLHVATQALHDATQVLHDARQVLHYATQVVYDSTPVIHDGTQIFGISIFSDFGPIHPQLIKIEQNSLGPHRGQIGMCRKKWHRADMHPTRWIVVHRSSSILVRSSSILGKVVVFWGLGARHRITTGN